MKEGLLPRLAVIEGAIREVSARLEARINAQGARVNDLEGKIGDVAISQIRMIDTLLRSGFTLEERPRHCDPCASRRPQDLCTCSCPACTRVAERRARLEEELHSLDAPADACPPSEAP